MKMIAGLDIGNGYVKGAASIAGRKSGIDFPSAAAIVTSMHDIKPSADAVGGVVADIFNQMDASFASALIKDGNTRRLFGKRGLNSGNAIEEFDVYSHISKASQDLSAILVLGCVAGKALQDYWNEKHTLPQTINVDASIALALPITEYKKYRDSYSANFKKDRHIVTINNFDHLITVEITFSDVQVYAEGAAATFAIVAQGEGLMNAMLADIRSRGVALKDITAADVLSAQNTIGIDIGEGTVNFPVMTNAQFNPDVSSTFNKGFGTVLANALERLNDLGYNFNSRKELADFIITPPSKMKVDMYNAVMKIVDEEKYSFAKEVSMQFIKVLQRVGSRTEVIYVYGGGATAMKEMLYPELLAAAKTFGGEGYPVLYLDSAYSRYLNKEGLYMIADMFGKK
jgi:plasmid segregation protein ParM